jgi:endoribonuclease Dicer
MAVALPAMAPPDELPLLGHSPVFDMAGTNNPVDAQALEDDDGHHSDEETDDEDKKSRKPHEISEKRKAQKTVFQTYINRHAKTLFKAARKAELACAKDGELSIASIIAQQQSETIADPREYQMELFDRAKKENIIAVLDTGAGKTLIAVLLLRHILGVELEDRAASREPRLSFFLVGLNSNNLGNTG